MRYYIFQVTDSLDQTYYLVNNKFIGYLGSDSNVARAQAEYAKGVIRTYLPVAVGEFQEHKKLHTLFCDNVRLSEQDYHQLRTEFAFTNQEEATTYQLHYPDRNSSACILRSTGKPPYRYIR